MTRAPSTLAFLLTAACAVDAPPELVDEASLPADCALPPHVEVLPTGHVVVQGDIIVGTLDDVRAACAAGRRWEPAIRDNTRGIGVTSQARLWPSARVPYTIDATLPEQQRVLDAITEWESLTTIDFVAKGANDTDYVRFTNGSTCSSSVGRVGGRQDIFLSTGKSTSEVVSMSISRVGDTYAWYADGMVSAGSTADLDSVRVQYAYTLPPNYTTSQIAGMAIAKGTGKVYTWYTNGMRSIGTSSDLDAYNAPAAFSLPPNKSLAQIIDMDIALDGDVYTWFSDGTVSVGTSTDLDAQQAPVAFVAASGQAISNIIGFGIAPADGDVYAWYSTGQVSAGSSTDLDTERTPYAFSLPGQCGEPQIIHEIGHAVGLKHEQTRCDRDSVARVFWANILPGKEHNFDKECGAAYDDLGTYNDTSIMQYGSYGFSVDGSPTLLKLVTPGVAVSTGDVVDMSISPAGDVYTWWSDGFVTSGSSSDLELRRSRYQYTLPTGYTTSDIVGIAIAKGNGNTYTFYRDGKRSIGTTSNLEAVSGPANFTLPPGYTTSDIVAIDIAPSGSTYVWFDNGRRSYGTSTDLDANGGAITYTFAPGRTVKDVLGIAISAAGDTYVWYDNGDVSAGSTTDLDSVRALYDFREHLDVFAPGSTLNAGDVDAVDDLY